MSKGKKVWNKPVIDTRKGLAKLKPIEKPKPRKDKRLINKVDVCSSGFSMTPESNKKIEELMHHWGDKVLQWNKARQGFMTLSNEPNQFNLFNDPVATFDFTKDALVEPAIKVPNAKEWAEEWYEQNK